MRWSEAEGLKDPRQLRRRLQGVLGAVVAATNVLATLQAVTELSLETWCRGEEDGWR